jgi:predicted amino acid-binding ACT domain protein
MVTVVGQKMRSTPGIAGKIFGALGKENVNVLAIAQSAAECTSSFVVAKKDVRAALAGIHREFQLGATLDRISGGNVPVGEKRYQHCEPVADTQLQLEGIS